MVTPAASIPAEDQYVPPTPLKVDQLQMLLQDHPQPAKVSYVLSGVETWFLPRIRGGTELQSARQPSVRCKSNLELIRDRLTKEIKLGRMWGPFNQPLFKHLMCSPVGLVPKKDTEEMRMIMHLSYRYGESINDFINEDKTSTSYQQFDDAIRLVQKFGQGCFMAKGDVKSAFKLAPMRYKDLECLGIFFKEQFYIDLTLPFGSSISCAIFEGHFVINTLDLRATNPKNIPALFG